MGWYTNASLALFTAISLLMTPATSANAQTIQPQQWDGNWYRLNSPVNIMIHNATSQTFDFQLDHLEVSPVHVNGNTAVYHHGKTKVTFVMTGNDQFKVSSYAPWVDDNGAYVHMLDLNGTYVSPADINGTYTMKKPLSKMTFSKVNASTTSISGHTLFAPGSWIVGKVTDGLSDIKGENKPIYWEAPVGKDGVIGFTEDVSWFPSGNYNLTTQVSILASGGTPVLQVNSNPLTMNVRHKNIGVDVRSYYKTGTPAYTVADFVYRNDKPGTDSTNADLLPGPTVELVNASNEMYSFQGADIYGLHYLDKTHAIADTTLLMGIYEEDQDTDWTPIGGPAFYLDYAFKLTKYKGKWLINGNDLNHEIARLSDLTGIYMD